MPRLEGVVWDHPRATVPIAAATDAFLKLRPDVDLVWHRRPLSAFEFEPIAETAAGADLLIFDHPFCGDIVASGCLLPVDGLAEGDFVGPSLATYRLGGHVWAVPIDAACQMSVWRPDLLSQLDAEPPRTWIETIDLGRKAAPRGLRVAVAFAGVHAFMSWYSLCASLGRACAVEPDAPLVDRGTGIQALELLRDLAAVADPRSVDWNSIALQDALAREPDLVFCPAVYGFATYAEPDRPTPLRFGPLAGAGPMPHAGSTIGGAGLGISGRVRDDPAREEAARAFARFASLPVTQIELFGRNRGQPARIEGWTDPDLDARFGGFFTATRRTLEAAWVRPRFQGYLKFQHTGGRIVEAFLRGDGTPAATLQRLETAWNDPNLPEA